MQQPIESTLSTEPKLQKQYFPIISPIIPINCTIRLTVLSNHKFIIASVKLNSQQVNRD